MSLLTRQEISVPGRNGGTELAFRTTIVYCEPLDAGFAELCEQAGVEFGEKTQFHPGPEHLPEVMRISNQTLERFHWRRRQEEMVHPLLGIGSKLHVLRSQCMKRCCTPTLPLTALFDDIEAYLLATADRWYGLSYRMRIDNLKQSGFLSENDTLLPRFYSQFAAAMERWTQNPGLQPIWSLQFEVKDGFLYINFKYLRRQGRIYEGFCSLDWLETRFD